MDNKQQHIFMSYNGNYQKMSPAMMEYAKDSLVFDKARKSIYAQNEEFGYIANTSSEVTIKSEMSNLATIRLTVQDGVVSLTQSQPTNIVTFLTSIEKSQSISPNSFKDGDVYEYGATVNVTAFSYVFSGSDNITSMYIDSQSDGSYYMPLTQVDAPTETMHTMPVSPVRQILLNGSYTHSFTLHAKSDNQMNYIERSWSFDYANHAFIGHISATVGGHAANSSEIVTKYSTQTLNALLADATVYSDHLMRDSQCGTSPTSQVRCQNGPSTYVFYAIPSNLQDLSGDPVCVLGGASVEEFNDVILITYTNGANFSEEYAVRIAKGQNWAGSKMYIN